ncbi:MAG: hypothetical protein IPL86_16100 [Flavobacteriales bacterium]|nr:hypothetical protein [Flavobacteriales bacterium]
MAGATGATGPVGGSDTQVIFNDSGAAEGDAGLTYNKTSNVLSIDSGKLEVTNTLDDTATVGLKFINAGSGVGTGAQIEFPFGSLTVTYGGMTLICGSSPMNTIRTVNGSFGFAGNSFQFATGANADVEFFNASSAGYKTTFKGPGDIVFNTYSGGIYSDKAIIRQISGDLELLEGDLKVNGTYTDVSNYVRGSLSATSSEVTLAAETAGTGADNVPVVLSPAGTAHAISNSPFRLPTFTAATLPSASTAAALIYVSDESGGAVPAFSDGTNWRRVTDRAIIS